MADIDQCGMFPGKRTLNAIYLAIDNQKPPPWPRMRFHLDIQDTSLPGWQALLDLIELAAEDKRETFSPKKDLGAELWSQVLTLPPSIGKLKHVKTLDLYRSNLIRIPPEIGEMESLVQFVPYTSYRLHWFPYEITRCKNLADSTVSTRALYGNYKYRQPFPSLESVVTQLVPECCSVCGNQMVQGQVEQVWISLGVASDVLPLLVNACSTTCINQLPPAAQDYVQGPHKGGRHLQQPPSSGL
jgi:hypothetical protein